jgi:hypothetical protein
MDPLMIAAVARLQFESPPVVRRPRRRRRQSIGIPSRVFYEHRSMHG